MESHFSEQAAALSLLEDSEIVTLHIDENLRRGYQQCRERKRSHGVLAPRNWLRPHDYSEAVAKKMHVSVIHTARARDTEQPGLIHGVARDVARAARDDPLHLRRRRGLATAVEGYAGQVDSVLDRGECHRVRGTYRASHEAAAFRSGESRRRARNLYGFPKRHKLPTRKLRAPRPDQRGYEPAGNAEAHWRFRICGCHRGEPSSRRISRDDLAKDVVRGCRARQPGTVHDHGTAHRAVRLLRREHDGSNRAQVREIHVHASSAPGGSARLSLVMSRAERIVECRRSHVERAASACQWSATLELVERQAHAAVI